MSSSLMVNYKSVNKYETQASCWRITEKSQETLLSLAEIMRYSERHNSSAGFSSMQLQVQGQHSAHCGNNKSFVITLVQDCVIGLKWYQVCLVDQHVPSFRCEQRSLHHVRGISLRTKWGKCRRREGDQLGDGGDQGRS